MCAYIIASFKDVDSIDVISVDDGGTEKCSENLSQDVSWRLKEELNRLNCMFNPD